MDITPTSLRVSHRSDWDNDVFHHAQSGDFEPEVSVATQSAGDIAPMTVKATGSRRVSLTAFPIATLTQVGCGLSWRDGPSMRKALRVFHEAIGIECTDTLPLVAMMRSAQSLDDALAVLQAISNEPVSLRPALLCQFSSGLRCITECARQRTRGPDKTVIEALARDWHRETAAARRWLLDEPASATQAVALRDLLYATLNGDDGADHAQAAKHVDEMLGAMVALPMKYWPRLLEIAIRHSDATVMLNACARKFVEGFEGRLSLVSDALAVTLSLALFRCAGAVDVSRMLDTRFGVSIAQQRQCVEHRICAEIVRARIEDGVALSSGAQRWRAADGAFRAKVEVHLLDVLAPRLRTDASWRRLLSEYGAMSEATRQRAIRKVCALERDVVNALGGDSVTRDAFIEMHDQTGQIDDWAAWLCAFQTARRMHPVIQPALLDRLANCLRRIPIDAGRAAWLRAEYVVWKDRSIDTLLDEDHTALVARAIAAVMKVWSDLAGPTPRDSVPLLRTMAQTAFARLPVAHWGPVIETLLSMRERHGHHCEAFVDTANLSRRLMAFLIDPAATMISPSPVFTDYAVNWSVAVWTQITEDASPFPTTRCDAYCDRLDLTDEARERVRRKVAHLSTERGA